MVRWGSGGALTSLLLLESQVSPVLLHAVAQGHPQLSLLLQRHTLPPLLNVGQGRVGDSVGGGGSPGDHRGRGGGLAGGPGDGGPQGGWCREAHHCDCLRRKCCAGDGVRRGRSRKDRGWMGSEKLVEGSLEKSGDGANCCGRDRQTFLD